ncbi:MAG: response regulator [Stenotrophomonas nitritireducens]|uniref:ATP-binding response regulator n=1 Tax=Stenotrophomonas nitritireducens TaxID=83617 RepID=UPI001AD39B1D|nr:hybrid sensor histidine kinase/response regulator [Stenotrophomonas nitritireducens]MBN8769808.1 response regulator [Stenotrophomonas sp.]MBN8790727.1 response regulator [Stenotrophomonas nitritireducens]
MHIIDDAGEARRRITLSFSSRLALLAILPAILTTVLVAWVVTRNYQHEVRQFGTSTTQMLADSLASAAAGPMERGDREELERIAAQVVAGSMQVNVQFLSGEGEIIADAGIRTTDGVHAMRGLPPFPGTHAPGMVQVWLSMEQAHAARRAQWLTTVALLAAGVLVAGGVSWRMARRMGRPIAELTGVVERIGRGERGIMVPVTRSGEVGRLQRGFNETSLLLDRAWGEMEARVAAATAELAHKNARLEAVGLARARFLAAASHDLRQPLYALTLFSSLLKAGISDPVQLERASHVQECVASLDALFAELLDISRLDSGAMQPVPSAFALDGLFNDISNTFRAIAEKRELRLVLRKTDVRVETDRIMLARIVNNLVSNALRYTRHGGVLVGVRRDSPGWARLEVWDTGLGIEPEVQQRVFEEFFQVDPGRRSGEHREYGLGLGLSTVERLARLTGCEVGLRSRPGRGSVFSVRVPLAAEDAQGMAAMPASDTAEEIDLAGVRVLVVDDEPAILRGMHLLLDAWGCRMRSAQDIGQALRIVAEWGAPDIVLTDLKLAHGKTGLDVVAALEAWGAKQAQARRFACLVVTGETKPEQLQAVRDAGMRVLYKPLPPEQLRAAMAAALAAQRT